MASSRLIGRTVRIAASVPLMALDAAAKGLHVTQYIEYNGCLPVKSLQIGLSRCDASQQQQA
jgi:hypothetical protein